METRKELFLSALKAGFIIAAVGIVLFVVEYVADIKPVGLMKPILMMLFGLAVNITLLVIFLKQYRTKIGGFISFGDAFLYCFTTLAVAALISTLFTFIFMKFFDPMYMKNIMEAQKGWMENYLAGKMPEDKIAEQLAKLDEQAEKATTIVQNVKNIGIGLIFGAIISLIVGAIMKKNPDVFDNSTTGGVI